MNDKKIDVVNKVRTLGVIFSDTLCWIDRVDTVYSKASFSLCLLYRHRQHIPIPVMYYFYNAFIFSHFNYCHLVWGSASKTELNKLYIVQKKFIRILLSLPYLHPVSHFFNQTGILSVNSLFTYRLACFYKHCIADNIEHNLMMMDLRPTVPPYSYRQFRKFIIPRSRTQLGEQRLCVSVPILLNSVDADISKLSLADILSLLCK